MCGQLYLLDNFPSQTSFLGDYIPILNLVRQLLREHADQVLPKPLPGPPSTLILVPGDWVLLTLQLSDLHPQWTGPFQVLLTTSTAAKLQGKAPRFHLSRLKTTETPSQHIHPPFHCTWTIT